MNVTHVTGIDPRRPRSTRRFPSLKPSSAWTPLRPGLGSCLLLEIPRTGQNEPKVVVPFVARVLIEALVGPRHGEGRGPRLRPDRRIADRELVDHSVVVQAREA